MAKPTLAVQIDNYLRRHKSPLAGMGRRFVRAGKKHGVDPFLLVAIAGAETGFGTYGPSQKIRNAWGWGPHIQFPTWQAGIDTIAAGLRKGYLNEGRNTIQAIGAKWAPQGASNDPTNLNSNWVKNVTKYYRELGGQGVTQPRVGPGPVPFGSAPGRGPGNTNGLKTAGLQALTQIASGQFDPVATLNSLAAARKEAASTGGTLRPPRARGGRIPESASPVINKVLQFAHKAIGTPYVWGGESYGEGGFDCSGLLDAAFRAAGIDLPGRLTSQSAMGIGRSVKGKKLQPGDAIITNGGKHIVMYVGGGKVIASPHRGAVVRYQPLSDFKGSIVDVRRFI